MDALMGSRIRALRTAKGCTQEQAADRLGISRQEYACIEDGAVRVTLDILTRIAKMLDVAVGDITVVLDEGPAPARQTGPADSPARKVFDMLDLFYANKHVYAKLQYKNGE